METIFNEIKPAWVDEKVAYLRDSDAARESLDKALKQAGYEVTATCKTPGGTAYGGIFPVIRVFEAVKDGLPRVLVASSRISFPGLGSIAGMPVSQFQRVVGKSDYVQVVTTDGVAIDSVLQQIDRFEYDPYNSTPYLWLLYGCVMQVAQAIEHDF